MSIKGNQKEHGDVTIVGEVASIEVIKDTIKTATETGNIPEGYIQVFGPTCLCRKRHSVVVIEEDLKKYESGQGMIYSVFPYLSRSEAEVLLSGANGECWDKYFGSEDE